MFKNIYRYGGGLYSDEMKAWAEGTNTSMSDIVLANCTYELSHIQEGINIFGCTAGIRYIPKVGMVHVRNMDWPIDEIGSSTRLFRFKQGNREFISVGIPGKVSVISGMLPGKYSITINWAPTKLNPKFDYGPSFLLREVFETCDTYDEAVSYLCGTDLSSSVFYAVCGAKKGEGCIIERTMNSYNVREWLGGVLVQGNHYEGRFKSSNDILLEPIYDDDLDGETALSDSEDRVKRLIDFLSKIKSISSIKDLRKAINKWPVKNDESHQQMVFIPKAGEYKVWRSLL